MTKRTPPRNDAERAAKLEQLKAKQASAKPLPPGPARDAVIALARWLARQDHEAEFGRNPPPSQGGLTEETEK